jgi:hypothetical protein
MTNRFGVLLNPQDVRWSAAEGVCETVIAAVLLLHERSVEDIAPQLSAAELEQVIKLVGRNPRLYAHGMLDALKSKKVASLTPTFGGVLAAVTAQTATQAATRAPRG